MTEDWVDPFTVDDPKAREREARRREREERRRARLGQRASEAASERTPPTEAAPVAPPQPAAEEPRTEPPPRREPEPPPRVPQPSSREPQARPEPQPSLEPQPEPALPPLAARSAAVSLPRRRSGAAIRRRRIAAVVALGVLALVIAFCVLLFQPFHGGGHGRLVVRIPKGASASEIADILDRKGVIDGPIANSTLFRLRLDLSGDSGNIEAGTYTLAGGMSYGDAIDALTTPPKQRTVSVTIPEGYDRRQAASLARQDGLRGDYMKATARAHGFDLARYKAPASANLEGFLFPATYVLHPGEPVKKLVGQQLAAFAQRLRHVDLSYAKSKNLTPYDVVKIASIVQREAGDVRDFPDVAAVIYNRLRNDMPLGVDATIRFITNNYTKPLTESELQIDSPYNTRTHIGLPPGPISNPGIAALKAAAHPPKVPYLYYVTKPGACGRLSFATTYAQFQRLSNQYNSARAAAGGKSPTTC